MTRSFLPLPSASRKFVPYPRASRFTLHTLTETSKAIRSKPSTAVVARTSFNMSEAFLYELFQQANVVRLEGEKCGICLEEFNTLSREKGTIEVAVRLPCNHIIGSACIATWLRDTNTCPICRREFFQAQPQPNSEHGIFNDEENENEGDPRTIEHLCDDLGLTIETATISRYLIQALTDLPSLAENHSQWCVIAVGIYIGSHITRDPRSPGEVAEIAGVDAAHLRETYDTIYPDREELTGISLLSMLEEVFDETNPESLNWPPPDNEITNAEIENRRDLQLLREGCEQGCIALGLGAAVAGLAARITMRYFNADAVVPLSMREIVAVSIFMASRMIGYAISLGSVAGVLRMDESRVRDAYRVAYNHQHLWNRQPELEASGAENMASLLRRVPSP